MNTKNMIEAVYPDLTKTEKRIADYILKHPNVYEHSLAEFSKTLQVGEATIVRFCRKLHVKGYQELKFSLALDAANENMKG